MEINKKSWHYRLVRFYRPSHVMMPMNLCSYFWSLIGSIIITPFVSPIFVIAYAVITIADWRDKPRKPNILTEYSKAVKDKVCPFIEYK